MRKYEAPSFCMTEACKVHIYKRGPWFSNMHKVAHSKLKVNSLLYEIISMAYSRILIWLLHCIANNCSWYEESWLILYCSHWGGGGGITLSQGKRINVSTKKAWNTICTCRHLSHIYTDPVYLWNNELKTETFDDIKDFACVNGSYQWA